MRSIYTIKNRAKSAIVALSMVLVSANAEAPYYPTGVAADNNGNLIMCEKGTKRIAIYAPDGATLLKAFPLD